MASPRHSPCLGYLIAIIFTLTISLQCVNSLTGVFNVQRKLVRKQSLMLKSHQRHKHSDRMLVSGPSPIDLPVLRANVTDTVYIMEVGIGTPPQMHKFLVDSGSDLIWVNCQGCTNCVTENKTLGVTITPFDPALSSTAKILDYSAVEAECRKRPYPGNRCGFAIGYGDGTRGVYGYMMEDQFMIGNSLAGQAATANLRFGCATSQAYNQDSDGSDFIEMGIDGIMGFGDTDRSIVDQLGSSGVSTKELAHCIDSVTGKGIFAIGHVVDPPVVMNARDGSSYFLDLMGMDIGGVDVKLNSTPYAPYAVFDSGSDVLYLPEAQFDVLTAKFDELMAMKNAIVTRRVDDTACFKLPGKDLSYEVVDQEFPIISFHFSQSQVLTVPPRNYIKPNDEGLEGYWCLYVWKYLVKWDDRDVYIMGAPVMSNKLVVYDNANEKLGFVDHDCSTPIQLEGGDGKPVSIDSPSGR